MNNFYRPTDKLLSKNYTNRRCNINNINYSFVLRHFGKFQKYASILKGKRKLAYFVDVKIFVNQ